MDLFTLLGSVDFGVKLLFELLEYLLGVAAIFAAGIADTKNVQLFVIFSPFGVVFISQLDVACCQVWPFRLALFGLRIGQGEHCQEQHRC